MSNIGTANAAMKFGSFAQFRADLLKGRAWCLRNLHNCIMHTPEHLCKGLLLAQHHVEPSHQLFYSCASKRGAQHSQQFQRCTTELL